VAKYYQPSADAVRYQQQIAEENAKRRGGGQEERLDKGTTVLRILPPWDETGAVSRLVSKWWKREMKWNSVKDGALPVISEMWPDMADQDHIMNALKRIEQVSDVSALFPKSPKFLVNALKASHTPLGVGAQPVDVPDWTTPRIVEVGKKINDWIHEQISDPHVGNITDPYNGNWIGIKRTGDMLSTEYDCKVYFKMAQKIIEDEALMDAIMAQLHNLADTIKRPDAEMLQKQAAVAEELLRMYNVTGIAVGAVGPPAAYPGPQTGQPAAPPMAPPPGTAPAAPQAAPPAPGAAAPTPTAPPAPGAPLAAPGVALAAPPPTASPPLTAPAPSAAPEALVAPPTTAAPPPPNPAAAPPAAAPPPPGGTQPPFPAAGVANPAAPAPAPAPVAPPAVHPPEGGWVPPVGATPAPGAVATAVTVSTDRKECFAGNAPDKYYLNEAICQVCAEQIECQQITMARSAPPEAQASTESPATVATAPAPGSTPAPVAPPVASMTPPATAAPSPSEAAPAPAPPVAPDGAPPCAYNLSKNEGPAEGYQCEGCLFRIPCEQG